MGQMMPATVEQAGQRAALRQEYDELRDLVTSAGFGRLVQHALGQWQGHAYAERLHQAASSSGIPEESVRAIAAQRNAVLAVIGWADRRAGEIARQLGLPRTLADAVASQSTKDPSVEWTGR